MPIAEDTPGDYSSRPRDRQTRVAGTQKKLFRGDADGRVRQASPVPTRAVDSESSGDTNILFVGPDDPGFGWLFWFDTDEPVAGGAGDGGDGGGVVG